MKDLYDIHCHILPGVDDGAKSMDMAVELLHREYEDGVSQIILTPHYRKGMFEPSMEKIMQTYQVLTREAAKIGVKLHLGCEFYVNMEMADLLESGARPTLAGSRHVLCEFSTGTEASFIRERCQHLFSRGFIPVLAHIERYDALTGDFDLIDELSSYGCLMQVNAGSILGKSGFSAKQFCKKLIKYDMLDLIGSDAHDLKARAPQMGACSEQLKKMADRVYTGRIMRENPAEIIKG